MKMGAIISTLLEYLSKRSLKLFRFLSSNYMLSCCEQFLKLFCGFPLSLSQRALKINSDCDLDASWLPGRVFLFQLLGWIVSGAQIHRFS